MVVNLRASVCSGKSSLEEFSPPTFSLFYLFARCYKVCGKLEESFGMSGKLLGEDNCSKSSFSLVACFSFSALQETSSYMGHLFHCFLEQVNLENLFFLSDSEAENLDFFSEAI